MDGLSQLVAQVMSPKHAATAPGGICDTQEACGLGQLDRSTDRRQGDETRKLVYAGSGNCLERSLEFHDGDPRVLYTSDMSVVDPGRVDGGCDAHEAWETAEASREDPSGFSMLRGWLDEKAECGQLLSSGSRPWTLRAAEMLESEAVAVKCKLEKVAKSLRETWSEACEQLCRGGALSRAASKDISSEPGVQAGFSTWVLRARAGVTGSADNAWDRSFLQGRSARVLKSNVDGRTGPDCSSPASSRSNLDFQRWRRGMYRSQENLEIVGTQTPGRIYFLEPPFWICELEPPSQK